MPRLGSGATQLRDVAVDLKRAGSPGRGLSSRMRRNIVAAVEPMAAEVRANALAIPATGPGHTGLRAALAHATRVSVSPLAVRGATVRLIVDAKRMPALQASLPAYEEGSDGSRNYRWRHPVFGGPGWAPQDSHPYVAPAFVHHLPAIDRGVIAAVDETALQIRGL